MFAARLRWSLCLASGMLFFANGCQDPNRPKLYPASGIVMHKDEPLTSGSLIFFPAEEMLKAFKDTGFGQDQILRDFHEWLTSCETFIRFRAKAQQ